MRYSICSLISRALVRPCCGISILEVTFIYFYGNFLSTKRASRINFFNLARCLQSIQDRLGLSVTNDGNQHSHGLRTPAGDAGRRKVYEEVRLPAAQDNELEIIFSSLRQVDCSLGEFHYDVCWTTDEK